MIISKCKDNGKCNWKCNWSKKKGAGISDPFILSDSVRLLDCQFRAIASSFLFHAEEIDTSAQILGADGVSLLVGADGLNHLSHDIDDADGGLVVVFQVDNNIIFGRIWIYRLNNLGSFINSVWFTKSGGISHRDRSKAVIGEMVLYERH